MHKAVRHPLQFLLALAAIMVIAASAQSMFAPSAHGQTVQQAMASQTLTRAQANSLPSLKGCFDYHGVQLSTHVAYECINQSVSGGALYWSHNLNSYNWDKHPADGLDWVEAATIVPNATSNPPQNFQAFWVGIGHGQDFCTVINPGYDQHPTQCETNGNVHAMTSKQQASYDAFAAAMDSLATDNGGNLPPCAWSRTISSSACDVG